MGLQKITLIKSFIFFRREKSGVPPPRRISLIYGFSPRILQYKNQFFQDSRNIRVLYAIIFFDAVVATTKVHILPQNERWMYRLIPSFELLSTKVLSKLSFQFWYKKGASVQSGTLGWFVQLGPGTLFFWINEFFMRDDLLFFKSNRLNENLKTSLSNCYFFYKKTSFYFWNEVCDGLI